jgi:hypothetical protein
VKSWFCRHCPFQIALGAKCLPLLLVFASAVSAQVIQVQAGASDMVPTIGGSVSVLAQGYEGYLGAGVLNGAFQIGTYAKTAFGSKQFTVVDQTLAFNLPTDIFGGSEFLTTRGVGAAFPGNDHVFLFGGVTTLPAGTPIFQAFQNQTPLALVFIDKPVTRNLHFYSRNIISHHQTWIEGFDWQVHPWLKTAVSAGMGSNKPYLAASLEADRNWYEIKAVMFRPAAGFAASPHQLFSLRNRTGRTCW